MYYASLILILLHKGYNQKHLPYVLSLYLLGVPVSLDCEVTIVNNHSHTSLHNRLAFIVYTFQYEYVKSLDNYWGGLLWILMR